MTNIAYIRGIDQKADIPAQVAPEAVYDPRQMSKGEFKLALLQDQLRILGEYYGNTEQLQAANQLRDYLAAGFHNLPTAMVGSSIPAVNKAVKAAKKLNQPAGKILIRENKAGGLTEGALAGLTGQAKIGDVLIPYQDCDQFILYEPDNEYDPYAPSTPASYLPGYTECMRTEQIIALLNQRLATSSHHLLYEYTTGQGDPGTVAAKRVLHRNAVSGIARISGLDRDSLRGWMRNGVMRNNMRGGLPPYQPEDSYYLLKTGVASGLGVLPAAAVTVKAVAELIALIIGAITATVALVSSMRPADRQLIENMAANIGTGTFGPEKDDFFSGGGPGGGGPGTGSGGSGSGGSGSGGSGGGLFTGDNSIIMPAAAAAAVLLLTSK